MQKLIFSAWLILLAFTVGCGSSKEKSQKSHTGHSATPVTYHSPDSIIVGHIEKTEAEWKETLTPDEYHILREAGTEPPYSSKLLDIKEPGVFYCAACGLPLYRTETKFESGTGWPSFWQPVEPKVVKEVEDRSLGTVRTEIVCAQCGSHIGHVFKDGPDPTGLRYCMNGLALGFKADVP